MNFSMWTCPPGGVRGRSPLFFRPLFFFFGPRRSGDPRKDEFRANLGGDILDLGGDILDLGGDILDLGGDILDLDGDTLDLRGDIFDLGGDIL